MKPSQSTFTVEEFGGDQFVDLAEAQRVALPKIAADIASTLRAMLASGDLIVKNGRVVVNKAKEQ
ncbi:MAG TPA: hypothetical protein VJ020_07860 [Anaerolineales bacterium]|nr:hypothetical protein [Anaerolineales bacterium]